MKKTLLFFLFLKSSIIIFANDICLSSFRSIQQCDADIAVIGAGPAGISVMGVFLDIGIIPQRIIWIDREFNVGRLSTYYNVPANTKNKFFIEFLESCKTFKKCSQNEIDKLKSLNLDKEYQLGLVVEPLKSITNCIMSKVNALKGDLQALYFENNSWMIEVNNKKFSAYNVVLATGSHPKTLNYQEFKSKEISLDIALDKSKLEQIIEPKDIIAVVGSSHSAILILKYLTELNVNKIINFYNKPIAYAIDMGTWTLNATTGLKGIAADWARNVLEKNPPLNLFRLQSKEENLKETLPTCTKIIYAIGFERNEIPTNLNLEQYNATNGLIGPRLFGIGIAFPEKIINPAGITEYHVGLDSFLEYAQKIVPCWMKERAIKLPSKKHLKLLQSFNELFTIEIL